MFRNSARSVSSPFRDYVCSSCLVRNHVPPPIRQQAVRFVSAGVAQADTGTTASDAVLCSTIAAEPGKANEGGGAPAEESTPAVENAKKNALKPETENAGAPKEKARGRKKKETAKEADASPKIRLYKAKEKQPPKPVRPRKVSGSEKAMKESTTKFVKNLKSLRAAKAESPSAAPAENEGSSGRKKVGARRPLETDSLEAKDLEVTPLDTELPKVPELSYGLDRVLFNPGVYHLQDPRSRVYNFDPYLGSIMPVSEFDFDALNEYITSSKDESLHKLALSTGKKYVGSSSSMTSVLAHFHYLLSQWRPINTSTVSQGFPGHLRSFTKIMRGPAAVFLRYNNGVYAVDADKEFENATVLMNLGKSMEKLLTLSTEDFERYRRTNKDKISGPEQSDPEAYHYSTIGDFIMRSQLDAYDPRLPGTGMFDLKTRAVVSIRMNSQNPEEGQGYQIKGRFGGFESYEREYFDMIRAAFLKYSLQVRIGRMDGIFVAFHNIERIFGFQYVSLPEMDHSIHGQDDTVIGDTEFKLSISLWNKILNKATERFPKQSLRFHFETREAQTPFMYIFAEPVTEEEVHSIQTRRNEEVAAVQKRLLYPETAQEEPATSDSTTEAAASDSPVEASTPDPGVEFGTAAGKGFKTLEEALGQKKGQDTTVTDSGTVNADGTSALGSSQNEEYDSTTKADTKFLDGLKKPEEGKLKPLLGMILTVQNKVNGVPVTRPNELKPEDDWKVDYEVTEFTSLARAWSVYEACQKRRATTAALDEDDDRKASVYLQQLKELSAKGREWRKRQDEIDRDYGTIALNLESKKGSRSEAGKTSSPSSQSSSTSPPPPSSSQSSSQSSSKPPDSSSPSVVTKFFKYFS